MSNSSSSPRTQKDARWIIDMATNHHRGKNYEGTAWRYLPIYIEEALTTARAEALEEAAQIATRAVTHSVWDCPDSHGYIDGEGACAQCIAEAIRELGKKGPHE